MSLPSRLAQPLRGSDLPRDCRDAYRRHLCFGLLDSIAAGILANAPLIALRAMASAGWLLALQLAISSVGMFLVLHLGGVMADRRKLTFVRLPGLIYAGCSAVMAACDAPLPFLILLGIGALCEIVTRPAMTAVLRLAYPATHRGAATGTVRTWQSLAFLGSNLLSAWALDRAGDVPAAQIRGQLLLAATCSAAAFLIFGTIRVREPAAEPKPETPHSWLDPMREAWGIARRDARFRRYLGIGLLYAIGGLSYVSFIPLLLTERIGLGYLGSALLLHILPSTLSFVATGAIGRFVDRVNPWRAWSWIRLGWGLDPFLLALAPAAGALGGVAAIAAAAAGRVCRGLVMGGSWILWWQVGVNHFAPPGSDTSRYMGMVLFMNGLARLGGPLLGAWLLSATSVEGPLLAGGSLVLLSAMLSARELHRERHDERLATMERFERDASPTPGR